MNKKRFSYWKIAVIWAAILLVRFLFLSNENPLNLIPVFIVGGIGGIIIYIKSKNK